MRQKMINFWPYSKQNSMNFFEAFFSCFSMGIRKIFTGLSLENGIERLGKSFQDANRVTGSLAIVFARLLIQYGDGNCKKGY